MWYRNHLSWKFPKRICKSRSSQRVGWEMFPKFSKPKATNPWIYFWKWARNRSRSWLNSNYSCHCSLSSSQTLRDIPWNIISWSRDASLERNMIFVTRISRDPSILVNFVMNFCAILHIFSIYIISILEEKSFIKVPFFRFPFLIKKKKKMYHKTFSFFPPNIFLSIFILYTLFHLRYQVFQKRKRKNRN